MEGQVNLTAPEPLTEQHDVTLFQSGVETLGQLLKQRALKNQISGASRTFVACDGKRVAAYHALATGRLRWLQLQEPAHPEN